MKEKNEKFETKMVNMKIELSMKA